MNADHEPMGMSGRWPLLGTNERTHERTDESNDAPADVLPPAGIRP
jgi:hypothetical protein